MYSLHDYTWMVADEARMTAYVRALESVVGPGSVVADIGTGFGVMALVACRLGARRVYAIDTSDAIEVGRELARENGVGDRIVFFQKDAREVELPERSDVIVSDLRGTTPLCGDHLAVIADARRRFLKPGGVLVPACDRLMIAVVEKPDLYEWALGPARGPLGVTLEATRARLRHAACVDRVKDPLSQANLVSDVAAWATLDYQTIEATPVTGRAELRAARSGVGHGLALWFEALLAPGERFSTAPGHELCYRRLFLPWPHPVELANGDRITIDLWGQAAGDPWGWNSCVFTAAGMRESFKQSSFLSAAAKPSVRGGGERVARVKASQVVRD